MVYNHLWVLLWDRKYFMCFPPFCSVLNIRKQVHYYPDIFRKGPWDSENWISLMFNIRKIISNKAKIQLRPWEGSIQDNKLHYHAS